MSFKGHNPGAVGELSGCQDTTCQPLTRVPTVGVKALSNNFFLKTSAMANFVGHAGKTLRQTEDSGAKLKN